MRDLSVRLFNILMCVSVAIHTHSMTIDGINYGFNEYQDLNGNIMYEASVSAGDYEGDIVVPNTVTYEGKVYKVTAIDADAFEYNRNITSVTLGENVHTINSGAFCGCKSLKSINLENITYFGDMAFKDCTSLSGAISLKEGLEDIWGFTFYKTSISSITFPSTIRDIDEYSFGDCASLKVITMLCKEPPRITETTFKNTLSRAGEDTDMYEAIEVIVPAGSIEAYRNAKIWCNFKNIHEANGAGIDQVTYPNLIKVSVDNGKLIVTGAEGNTPVEIYNVNGQCVYRGSGKSIDYVPSGAYIVKVNNKSFKFGF